MGIEFNPFPEEEEQQEEEQRLEREGSILGRQNIGRLSPDQVRRTTTVTDEDDKDDVRDIAAGIVRAAQKQQQEVGGPLAISGQENLRRRSQNIERAIERLPGEENTLGLARTGFSIGKFFVDNILGVANTIRTGIDAVTGINVETDIMGESLLTKRQTLYDSEKYGKYYRQLVDKEDRSAIRAGLLTALKVFEDSPELKNEGEFIKGVIDRLAGQAGTITAREADEITGYWRPEASATEQVLRAIPEIAGGTAAGIKFFARSSKKIIKEFEDTLGKSVLKATDDEIAETVTTMMKKATFKLEEIPRVSGLVSIRRKQYGQRVTGIVKMKQAPERLRKNSENIRAAKAKVREARTKGDEALIRQERAALSMVRRERLDAIPKQLIEIPITETGAVLGAAIGGNIFGEEYGALIGALGGGIGSAVGFEVTYQLAKGMGQSIGSFVAGLGNSIGVLNDNQIRQLAEKGFVTDLGDITSESRKALTGFATFIRSLPKEQREEVFAQIKLFKEARDELIYAGVDPEVLDTTMGKATGLIPLMMMKDTISQYKLNMSKGLGKVDKDLQLLLDNESNINAQLNEFRGLLDRLSGSAGAAGQNTRLNRFIDSMRSVANQERQEIVMDSAELRARLNEFVEKANDPALRLTIEDQEAFNDLIAQAMRSGLIREGAFPDDPAAATLRDETLPELAGLGERAQRETAMGVVETENEVLKFLTGYLSPQTYQRNAEVAAENFQNYANLKRIAFKEGASAQFTELENMGLKVDISDWLRDLYGDDAYVDIIPHTGRSKILQRLGKRRIANAGLLDRFARLQGRVEGKKALDNNPALKDAIKNEMIEQGYFDDLPEGIIRQDIDIGFDDVKRFFAKEYRREPDETITDFDVFTIMREFAEVEDLGELTVEIGVKDIQRLSSAFSASAATAFRRGDRAIADKDAKLAESVVDALDAADPAVAERLRKAKTNYVNNVIRRYRDKSGNPIGYNVDQPLTGKEAIELIDIGKLVRGNTQDGADIIDHLTKTFGRHDEATGEYILDGEAQVIVRNLMNDLLARHISEQEPVLRAKEFKKTRPPLGVDVEGKLLEADDALTAEKRAAGRRREIKRTLESEKTIVESPAITRLREYEVDGKLMPLIDFDRVRDYNKHVEVALGNTEILSNAEKQVKQDIKTASARAISLVDQRQKFLEEVIKVMPVQEGARSLENYDTFLNFYVSNPRGLERFRASIPVLAKQMNVSEGEVKELFSDLTVEAVSRATYGDMREYRAGEYLADFDYRGFINFIKGDTGDTIREIVGEEKFRSITRMADMLNIQNRDLTARLRESGINVTTPKGLSVESLLSRAYSISRGVISPKYVATEVALLSFRKKRAAALTQILSDPKMVDAVIEIVETGGGDVIKRYNANINTVLINGLAYNEVGSRKEKREQQIRQLELDKFRR